MRGRSGPGGRGGGGPHAAIALVLPLLVAFSGATASAQPPPLDPQDACFDSLGGVYRQMGDLTEEAVARFLRAVHSTECRDDLDFAEWSTETLYDLMQDAPETFFRVLRRSPTPVQDSVVDTLESPAGPFIDYPGIHESISTRVRDKQLREYALRIFAPFYQRYLKEQRAWERLDGPTDRSRPR